MSWRTVIVSTRCKLDYKMGFLVVRGEETKRLFIDEIAVLVLENTAISLTGCLLQALVEKKVRVIFCDDRRSPMAELAPYYGSYDCSRKIKTQTSWSEYLKGAVWVEIISDKIRKQSAFLREVGKKPESELIASYIDQIEQYDASNREGHAAKVYFNALFGMDFTRSSDNATNAALNYGYSIILSAFNREITSNGYLTQIGIFHDNMFNFYNLSCDFMEPFRVLVDRKVFAEKSDSFGTAEKHAMWDILNQTIVIDSQKQTVLNAVRIFVRSVFESLNDSDISKIKTYKQPDEL